MDLNQQVLRGQTRRHFFKECGLGVGKIALASLLAEGAARAQSGPRVADPLAPKSPHFPAKVKSVIYLFMAGGPSQLELFDYKPRLNQLDGQAIPESYLRDRRFAFMNTFTNPRLLGTRRRFARRGRCGAHVSELLPHVAGVVDDLAFVKAVRTDVFNHAPAKLFINTGAAQFGR